MQKCYKKVAIIGGGASGIICAIYCAKNGVDVDIFEQNDKTAKKIIASGNGRCNISNSALHVEHYHAPNYELIKNILKEFDFEKLQKFCDEIGLLLDIKDDGRVYPLANDSKSVALLFEKFALSFGVNIFLNSKVVDVKKDEQFEISTQEKSFKEYDAVVVSSGSLAWPSLGVSDIGYEVAKSFDMEVVEPYPSLVQLHVEHKSLHRLSGLKVDAQVSLYIDGKRVQSVINDLLFTKYGLSGFAVLDISHRASEALQSFQAVTVGINFLHSIERARLLHVINSFCSDFKSIEEMLQGIVPKKIASFICDEMLLEKERSSSTLNSKEIKKIVSYLNDFRVNISDTHGLKHAEVSGGGVDLSFIDSQTLQSTTQKGLYFCGEVLDVTGERGGYNLHFAFASGYVAAKSISSF